LFFLCSRFRLDRGGRLFLIDVLRADSGPLARSCVSAFHDAEPFDAPPQDLAGQIFLVTFQFGDASAPDTAQR
jgi:hypothetical protein